MSSANGLKLQRIWLQSENELPIQRHSLGASSRRCHTPARGLSLTALKYRIYRVRKLLCERAAVRSAAEIPSTAHHLHLDLQEQLHRRRHSGLSKRWLFGRPIKPCVRGESTQWPRSWDYAAAPVGQADATELQLKCYQRPWSSPSFPHRLAKPARPVSGK